MSEDDDIVLTEDSELLEKVLDLVLWDFDNAPSRDQVEHVIELLLLREDRDLPAIQRCIAECRLFLKDHTKDDVLAMVNLISMSRSSRSDS